ncbi:class I SAM-dependent methyltransferase [Paenibacillus sp. sptzw28]|nr:class I SAM-dependent methyltransferase [Paenibacillus sp. sptzw28]
MKEDGNREVKSKFDEIAGVYDRQRRMLIPRFDDLYNTPTDYAQVKGSAPKILDLGAGTGLFSSFMLSKYPDAELTLIDLSSNMMDIARARFNQYSNVSFIVADYSNYVYREKYDLIISSLSIHHLEDLEKKAIYEKAFKLLNDGGMFINADQVLGATPPVQNYYQRKWIESVQQSGLSRDDLELALERMKLDKYATVRQQLEWLSGAGFTDVDCIYQHYNFAVMTGRASDC